MAEKQQPQIAYIRGERHSLTADSPERKPPEHENMDDALAKLAEVREGGRVRSDRDPPRRPEDSAFDDLQARKADAREQAEREKENQRQREAEKTEREIAGAFEWQGNDPQILAQTQADANDFEARRQRFIQAQQWTQQNPDKVSPQERQQLADEAKSLREKQQELAQAAQAVQQARQIQTAEAERRKLHRDAPELGDDETREKFLEWVESKGIPRDIAAKETRREFVTRAWHEYQQEQKSKREKWLDRPRKPVAARGGAGLKRMTLDEARGRLRSGGTTDDALNVLTFEREQARERNDG